MENSNNMFERNLEAKRRQEYMDDLDVQAAKEAEARRKERREETMKNYSERRKADEEYKSYGSHGLDFSGQNKHGENLVSEKIHTKESNDNYARQMSEHYREKREYELSAVEKNNSGTFSSSGVNKVYTTRIENGAVTYSGGRNISVCDTKFTAPSDTSSFSLPKLSSQYARRTTENIGQDNYLQASNKMQEPLSISESQTRFRYVKSVAAGVMDTSNKVYSNMGGSVYRTATQRGDYDTLHYAKETSRYAAGTIAAVKVMSHAPQNTLARTKAISSYAKATLSNAAKYIKGADTASYINTPMTNRPYTLQQVRAQSRLALSASQYAELAEKYGSMSKLSLADIEKQISALERKKEFGSLSDFQRTKLTRLGELKDIHKTAIHENGQFLKLSASRVDKEISRLLKLKKAGVLTAVQTIQLEKLTELSALHKLKGQIRGNIHAKRKLNLSISRIMRQALSKTDEAGVNGLFMATELCTNTYSRAIIRNIWKLNSFIAKTAAHYSAAGIRTLSDKTGLTKQVHTLQAKTTKRLMTSRPGQSVLKFKGKINGGLYNEAKRKISSAAPQGLKTAAKNAHSALSTVHRTGGKVSQALQRGYSAITKPFRVIGQGIQKILKFSKGIIAAAGGAFLILFIIIAIVSVISSATSSIILEDTQYLNEYIAVLNECQTEFKDKLATLGNGYRNVVYNYTDGSKMNNTREILCMSTVYFQQDFSDKNAVKAYLKQMFNASHFYASEESPVYYCSDGAGCSNVKKEKRENADGTKETVYICQGHKDLTVTITALAFDEIFNATMNATGVGDLCFAFETGGQTLGSYNCWYCEDINDGAGMNYGMMSTNRSQARSMWNYIKTNSPALAARFAGTDAFTGNNLNPFGIQFNNIWKGSHSAEETAEMERLQRAWVWNAYGSIWCADLQSRTGVDMTRSWALQEVALSRAVHRGAYSASVFSGCVNSSMTDEQIIDAIYDYESSHLPGFNSRWSLERGFAKTFLGREFPTDDTEQFSWTDDNIEWCKNLYDQNWEELYDGLVGLNSASVGSSMSEAEVEALIGSLDGLSEERKNILSWACSAVGKIPYHWDWRNYWTINSDDWGSPAQPDYKGRNLKGLDCSGFVIWCYNKAGFDPVTCGWGAAGWTGSIADSMKTHKISASELKPGDIGMTGAYPYTHTGIYAGNGKWIHCTGAPSNNTVCNSYGGFGTYYRMVDLD